MGHTDSATYCGNNHLKGQASVWLRPQPWLLCTFCLQCCSAQGPPRCSASPLPQPFSTPAPPPVPDPTSHLFPPLQLHLTAPGLIPTQPLAPDIAETRLESKTSRGARNHDGQAWGWAPGACSFLNPGSGGPGFEPGAFDPRIRVFSLYHAVPGAQSPLKADFTATQNR